MSAVTHARMMRAWAHGCHTDEAGAELLIRSGLAARHDLATAWRSGDLDLDDLERAFTPLSGAEQRIVAIALSLLAGGGRASDLPVDLTEVLPGLDRRSLDLVLAAIAHAAGSHEHREKVYNDQGSPADQNYLPAAHPWPGPDQSPTS